MGVIHPPHYVRGGFHGAAMTIPANDKKTHPNDLITCADGRIRPRGFPTRSDLAFSPEQT